MVGFVRVIGADSDVFPGSVGRLHRSGVLLDVFAIMSRLPFSKVVDGVDDEAVTTVVRVLRRDNVSESESDGLAIGRRGWILDSANDMESRLGKLRSPDEHKSGAGKKSIHQN